MSNAQYWLSVVGKAALAGIAGVAGGTALAAGATPGLGGGSTSGPFWPQPVSVATTRQSGNRINRRMAAVSFGIDAV